MAIRWRFLFLLILIPLFAIESEQGVTHGHHSIG